MYACRVSRRGTRIVMTFQGTRIVVSSKGELVKDDLDQPLDGIVFFCVTGVPPFLKKF